METEAISIIEALVPGDDVSAVRGVLRQRGWDWTESPARGGWWGRRSRRLTMWVAASQVAAVVDAIHAASPPRWTPVRPRSGWDLATWLGGVDEWVQGAVVAWWPATRLATVDPPDRSDGSST